MAKHPTLRASRLAGLVSLFIVMRNAPAQPVPQPGFEVATVKPSSGNSPARVVILPGGLTYSLMGVTVKNMIFVAYDVTPDRVSGGPSWVDFDKYDVEATADHATNRSERMQMLQALLSERFKLVLRCQPREMPVYVLTVDKGGPKLAENADKGPSQMSPASGQETRFHNISMATFTGQFLTGRAGRPVLDQTGLTGSYDFDLKSANPSLTANPAEDGPALPDLFSALREQLGLRLEATKAPVDFLVVEHVEKPSGN